jgi:hypothetical protein
MTDEQIRALGPAFAAKLRRYRGCFAQDRTAAHFDTYCRGLVSDLPRKSVEPIALAAATAVRTLQGFLVTATWDHAAARQVLHRRVAEVPPDPAGGVVIDETSAVKKGDKTPGVQRRYLGGRARSTTGSSPSTWGWRRGRSRRCWRPTCTCRRRGRPTESGAGRWASRTGGGTGPSGGSRWTNCRGCTRTGCGSTG